MPSRNRPDDQEGLDHSEAFSDFWKERFGSLVPLSHVLRTSLADRWFRAHSLPGSERYPETPADMAIVLSRYRALADEVLEASEDCWLVCATAISPSVRQGYPASLDRTDLRSLGQLVDDGTTWWLFGRNSSWEFDRWLHLMREVAEGAEGTLLVVSQESGEVFAPYDGGCDLIVNSSERASELWERYRAWRSAEPSGL